MELDPATLSAAVLMYEKSRMVPIIGTLRKKFTATGKNPLNKRKNPYISTHIPITGHPNNTINIPPTKKLVAFNLCLWKKNRKVLSNPMTNASPHMNSIFPIASNPLSNKNKTPRNRKAIPKPAKPTPIF